ncbi:hypothetical protein GCM10010193_09020 [Kitasatospora atroaurantiaca]|uniref:Uncharacterized protein n=1 Tax=Kitasatospora atroaurantiaca TaxID=285545 RepID=A0A561ERY6_9ACTN|nr:hypothetical protein [Kitasatospora atroaurantiaca]TWE18354.1 hypothetical protein FB465_3421 [Kitasatospora atroaurantiaca]
MAAKDSKTAKPKTAREKKVDEIRDAISRAASVVAEGNAEALENLTAEVHRLIGELRGTGVAAEKATLRNEFEKAVAKAQRAAKKAAKAKPVEAVVILHTVDYRTNPETVKRVGETAKKIADGFAIQRKASDLALEIAQSNFSARVLIDDKNGEPDWQATTAQGKQISKDAYAAAGQALGVENDEEARLQLASLVRSVQDQSRTAAVLYHRELSEKGDQHPDAPRWKKAAEAFPDAKLGDAVVQFYKLPELTKAEELRAKRELEGGNGGDGEGDGEKGHTPRFFANLSALKDAAEKAAENAPKLKEETDKATARAELKTLMESMAAILKTL